jgi:hypothetical protein
VKSNESEIDSKDVLGKEMNGSVPRDEENESAITDTMMKESSNERSFMMEVVHLDADVAVGERAMMRMTKRRNGFNNCIAMMSAY